jgi:hypothetical protein
MKKLHVIGVMLIAAVAFSALGGSAVAAEWLLDGSPIATATAATTEGNVVLEADGLGAGVECHVVATGTVGPGAADEVKTVAFSGCVKLGNCSTFDSVAAVNLPWKTEVLLVNGKWFDDLTQGPGAAGAPGYLVECLVGFLLADNVCKKAEAKVELVNLATDVEDLFNTEEEAECTTGGPGLVHGAQLTFVAGHTLQES